MSDQQIKNFAKDLRRLLYLQQILGYSVQCMKDNPLTPSWLKVDIGNLNNSCRRLMADLADKGVGGHFKAIQEDVGADRLHDISLHIDAIADVVNIEALTGIITKYKEPLKEAI